MDFLQTLGKIDDAFLEGGSPSTGEREAAVTQALVWLRGPGSATECSTGGVGSDTRLLTGERLRTRLAWWGIRTVESCRILALLKPVDREVRDAMVAACRILSEKCYANNCFVGECAPVSVAYWRYLNIGAVEDAEARLEEVMRSLRNSRDGSGGWGRLPFYYTLLALTEIGTPMAGEEIRYAVSQRPKERLKRAVADEPYDRRRRAVLEKAWRFVV